MWITDCSGNRASEREREDMLMEMDILNGNGMEYEGCGRVSKGDDGLMLIHELDHGARTPLTYDWVTMFTLFCDVDCRCLSVL